MTKQWVATAWTLTGLSAVLSLVAFPAAGQSTTTGSKTATAGKAAGTA